MVIKVLTPFQMRPLCPGLILVIFLTEPVGFASYNLIKLKSKTMSPVKMSCKFLQSHQPRFGIAATDYMM